MREGESETEVIVTENSLVLNLTDELRAQIAECVRRSGSATFSIKEVNVTNMPAVSRISTVVD